MNVGDRVEMQAGKPGWFGVPLPDLGQGTVVSTRGANLMEGMYVEVEWDHPHGSDARYPSVDSLRNVQA